MSLREDILSELTNGRLWGFEIRERIERRRGFFGRLALALGFYPTIRAMQDEGVLKVTTEPGGPERAYRPRYYYEIAE